MPTPKRHKSCAACSHRKDNPLCSTPNVAAYVEKIKIDGEFKSGQQIFREGDSAVNVYSIVTGIIRLEKSTPDGQLHTIALYGPGDLIGFMENITNSAFNANAICASNTELCIIPKGEFLSFLKNDSEVALKLLIESSKRLQLSESKWLSLLGKSAPARVAQTLLFLYKSFPEHKWTRKEIAQIAGTTTETVIRSLGDFEKENIIDQSHGRKINILNEILLLEKSKA